MKQFDLKKIKQFLLIALLSVFSTTLFAQTAVTGKLTNDDGEPLAGVSVKVKGSKGGGFSNTDGIYNISAPANGTLVFTYIGFDKVEVAINGKTNIDIALKSNAAALDEVVVIGYGSQRKKDVTGSVTSIKAKDLNNVNAISIDNMLQGRAAGVQILQRSAQPGGGLSITIRGALSPNGGNEPLYVIDGVPLSTVGAANSGKTGSGGGNNIEGVDRSPLASINPNDILSIEILKDASAAAIYGAAAANGVILISTKRGTSGDPTISFSTSYSTQSLATKIKPLNAQDFMNYSNLAVKEDYLFDNRYAPYGPNQVPANAWPVNFTPAQIAAGTESYNHFDNIFRTGAISDNNVSVSGGNDKTKYFSSFSYLDQKSLLRTTDFSRFSGRINLDQTFNSWFKLSLNTLYSQTDANNPSIGGDRNNANEARQTQAAMLFSPRLPLELPDGSLSVSDFVKIPNPAAWLYMKDKSVNRRLFIAPNFQFKINSDLNANVVIGYDNTNSGRENFSPIKAKLPEQIQNNYAGFSNNENTNYSAETYLTYNKQLTPDHRLSVVAGAGYYRASGIMYGLSVFNLPTDAVENYNLNLAPQSDLNWFYSDKFARTKISQFGRINYVFKEKYFLALTARNDGSSAFPPQKKWGFFPAVSAAWSISDENFLKNVKFINNIKLRASYGGTGNESFLTNNIYYLDRYAASFGTNFYIGGQQNTGVAQTQIANNNLRWETNITANLGLDFGFLNNRLNGSVDVFQRTAKNLIDFAQLQYNSSITTQAQNVGSTRSRGIELALNGLVINKTDFIWNVNLNLSKSRVTWLERNPRIPLNPWVGANDGVFDIYGWQTNGLFKSGDEVNNYKSSNGTVIQPGSFAGNVKYIDQNDDGIMNKDDIVKLGNSDPNFNFGFGTSVRYKAFDLNVQTYGFIGRSMVDGWQPFADMASIATKANQHQLVTDVWSSFNPNGFRPGIATSPIDGNNLAGRTDYFLTKVNFLRVKSLTLGYTIPVAFLQKKRIAKNVKLFVDFQNLAIFTNYQGLDAEMGLFVTSTGRTETNASPFPIPRTTAFGLNVTF